MPLKKACVLTIIFCCIIRLAHGQEKGVSNHHLSIYKNDQKLVIKDCELSITTTDSVKIVASRVGNVFTFSKIDTSKSFTITIKADKMTFTSGLYKAWYLNNGSRMIFGTLTKINNLLSVAEYNDMTEKDENWDILSKRFFIVDRVYTIDINDFKKVRELQFLIINPDQQGDGSYSLTQKIIRLRK
jgi:uncharacterized protein YunC (DUF1805 family)